MYFCFNDIALTMLCNHTVISTAHGAINNCFDDQAHHRVPELVSGHPNISKTPVEIPEAEFYYSCHS